ncbi:flagellar hook-basal body complex protein [Helicobacter cholecystus]|uniref:Flagellar hook-basal body complex protein n=1 Tax=Helicobacter cholecystus TaxID=45498 RepID=A0A3D8IUK6_9HELI|nr:flagellar hook-basal body complex protein [Helicobacter cholecystus]RDU68683.1 flagellar hook-basal body complex protein [Helicobacter cholecystus]VEJ26119.1 flagellar hook protein [Helicobacter cholecystus]
MNNTLLSSYSGIKTHQFGIDSISNNIANVNTTGYRESRPEFETLLSVRPNTASSSPTSNDINLGVSASSNAYSTKSGSYRVSDGEFHMAYQGKGWFVVGEKSDGEMSVSEGKLSAKQNNFFTRDGSFGKDYAGYLVNSNGYYVYGVNLGKIKDNTFNSTSKEEDIKGLSSTKLEPLQIPQDLYFKPLQTNRVDLAINLNKTQNPVNAYKAFSQDEKLDEQKIFDSDVNIFFANQKSLDSLINNEATIELTDPKGESKKYTFTYGDEGGKNQFRTIGELKKLIKDNTGLDLNLYIDKQSGSEPSISLSLSSTTLAQGTLKTSGSFFDSLGMSTVKEGIDRVAPAYSPVQTYEPNELVTYLGIVFRKTGGSGSENPLNGGWEVADTSSVPTFDPQKQYKAGEVVNRDGNIYMMDENNQFLKIAQDTAYEIPTFDPQKQYGANTVIKYNDKLYQRVGSTGNSNPAEDQAGWKPISIGNIISKELEVPHYQSNVDVFDADGKKYRLVSDYYLTQGFNSADKSNQSWDVYSSVIDIASGNKAGEVSKHTIVFDQNNQPIAPEVEIAFKDEKIIYNLAGVTERKSSNELYAPSEIVLSEQDGNPAGVLENTSIDDDGVIFLKFSNGRQEAMGRIGVMAFTNDQGLSKVGGNLYGLESTLVGGEKMLRSGKPILGWDENGKLKFGAIKHHYLETSNVDVGSALTELILMQRGYSMNAKSFTAGDEMIKEAINLKK